MKYLILEDSLDRISKFYDKWNGNGNIIAWTDNVEEFFLLLNEYDYDVITLDHDLVPFNRADFDYNTGITAVNYIIENNYSKKPHFFVHSMNPIRGREMVMRLKENGYKVTYRPGSWE